MSARATRRLLLAVLSGAVLAVGGLAAARAQAPGGGVTVTDAWARATPPHAATGVAYMTLTSPAGDRLVGISSPAAGQAGVHSMTTENGVMRMRPVEGGLDLPAGQPVVLAPGGLHVMLQELTAPLRRGGTVALHLTFAKAPPMDVMAPVEAMGATSPGMKMP